MKGEDFLFLVYFITTLVTSFSCLKEETLSLKGAKEQNLVLTSYPDQPLQIVKPDNTHKKLVIVEENLKLLYDIPAPVATVAVVGKFHSGKSFLMNQLMGKSNGFGIGPSVKPKTMGIWIWGRPVPMLLASGKKVSILFLDTEGFAANNVSENYDAKVFAVATLISSHLLYNSVKIIDQSDIDYLELLARRTQLFALRSQMSRAKWTNNFIHDLLTFPPLIWVVQDFVQSTVDGESNKEWLHRLMESHTRENEDYEISLLRIFSSIDCHTLFLPAIKRQLLMDLSQADEGDLTEEYKKEREDLVSKLKKNIIPKEKNGRPISGRELAGLLEILVNAANDGSLNEVPSRWITFVEKLKQTAMEDCLKFYEEEMSALDSKHNSGPVKMQELKDWSNQSQSQAFQLLSHLLQGLDDAKDEAQRKLVQQIGIIYQRTRDMNEKKIKLRLSELEKRMELKAEEMLRSLQLPVSTIKLEESFQEMTAKVRQEFVTELAGLVGKEEQEKHLESLRHSITILGGAISSHNSKAIESVLQEGVKNSIEVFQKMTINPDQNPRKPELLTTIIQNGMEDSEKTFHTKCSLFVDESLFPPFRGLLKTELSKLATKLERDNEELVRSMASQIVKDLLIQFKQNTNSLKIPLPLNETDLTSRLEIEGNRIMRECVERMEEFQIYPIYKTIIKKVKEGMQDVIQQRNEENVEAFKREVERPLDTAKQIILLSAEKYTTEYGLQKYMKKLCLLQLNDGNPKHWPVDLKVNIIESFVTKDKDLQDLLSSRRGLWSSVWGFIEWLLCCFYLI